jgi:hypothetical protein
MMITKGMIYTKYFGSSIIILNTKNGLSNHSNADIENLEKN